VNQGYKTPCGPPEDTEDHGHRIWTTSIAKFSVTRGAHVLPREIETTGELAGRRQDGCGAATPNEQSMRTLQQGDERIVPAVQRRRRRAGLGRLRSGTKPRPRF